MVVVVDKSCGGSVVVTLQVSDGIPVPVLVLVVDEVMVHAISTASASAATTTTAGSSILQIEISLLVASFIVHTSYDIYNYMVFTTLYRITGIGILANSHSLAL